MKLPFTVNWCMGIIAAIHEKYSCCFIKNFYCGRLGREIGKNLFYCFI